MSFLLFAGTSKTSKYSVFYVAPISALRKERTTCCVPVKESDTCNWDVVKWTHKCHQTQPVKSTDLGHCVQTRCWCYIAILFFQLSTLHCTCFLEPELKGQFINPTGYEANVEKDEQLGPLVEHQIVLYSDLLLAFWCNADWQHNKTVMKHDLLQTHCPAKIESWFMSSRPSLNWFIPQHSSGWNFT